MRIRFDAEDHAYFVDGQRKHSVTGIIQAAGIGHSAVTDGGYEIGDEVMEEAQERGERVHLAVRFYLEGSLDWETVDEEDLPYVEAIAAWVEDTGFVADMIEQPVYSEELDVCGTVDIAGWIGEERTVVDIKTSSVGKKEWHRLQLAAYGCCISSDPVRRIVVQPVPKQKTKKYRAHEFERETYEWDKTVFLAARLLQTWRDQLAARPKRKRKAAAA